MTIMTPDQLVEAIPRAFSDTAPELAATEAIAAGIALREQYRDCADRFEQIVGALGSQRARDGVYVTPVINLGPYDHPRFGTVNCSATIRLTPYNPGSGNDRKVPFNVETVFMGHNEKGKKNLANEHFGARGFNFRGIRPPHFVRVPSSPIDEPWDQNESDSFDYNGGEYPWDFTSYTEVRNRLSPMIDRATDTQDMLIAALQDSRLNPQLSERASGLTVVRTPTFTV